MVGLLNDYGAILYSRIQSYKLHAGMLHKRSLKFVYACAL